MVPLSRRAIHDDIDPQNLHGIQWRMLVHEDGDGDQRQRRHTRAQLESDKVPYIRKDRLPWTTKKHSPLETFLSLIIFDKKQKQKSLKTKGEGPKTKGEGPKTKGEWVAATWTTEAKPLVVFGHFKWTCEPNLVPE